MYSRFSVIASLSIFFGAAALAAPGYNPQTVSALKTEISRDLVQTYRQFSTDSGGLRIELGEIRLLSGTLPSRIDSVSMVGENSLGSAQFAVYGGDAAAPAQVQVAYAAWARVFVASARVLPAQRLASDKFGVQEVNLAAGNAYELRGVLVPAGENLGALQSRQTILEGQYLVSSAVEKVPDVRRGDSVRIRLVSGDLSLSTLGTAIEPGYSHSSVKVLTANTHRELTGILQPGGIVEVRL